MNRLFIQKIILGVAALCCSAALVSCSKWDDFQKYTEGGEIVYTGKMDSVVVFGGKKRVRLVGQIKGDPKIVKAKIYWNDLRDSVMFDIAPSGSVRIFDQTFAVDEGTKSFTVFTYDAAGHRSVSVSSIGTVYGDLYQRSIRNRDIADAVYKTNGSVLIRWADVNSNSGIVKMQIKYMDKLNNMHDTLITSFPTGLNAALLETSLPNYKAGTSFSYRTAYLPSSTAIDTFYVDYKTHKTIDVTSLYLSNVGPFTRATLSGRWGTLAAPWVTNAAAKNKGGINGGYTTDNGGAINWETYGNTPVVNGIVYQATSLPLPAGKYIVSFDEYSEIQTNSSVYCVVAAGGNGIPILADLSTALGSQALYNGAVVNTNAPSLTDTRSVEFTLATSQVVSIGFLGNLAVNNYFRISAIRLSSN
jgi:hypothetical protein